MVLRSHLPFVFCPLSFVLFPSSGRDSRSIGNWQHWQLATFPHWQHSSRPLAHAEELERGAEVGRERRVRLDLRALHHALVQVKRVAKISAPRRNYLVY